MLNIFQKFVTEQNYSYLKLEGTTYIGSRQSIINKFNQVMCFFNVFFSFKSIILRFYVFLGLVDICYDSDHKSWWIRC